MSDNDNNNISIPSKPAKYSSRRLGELIDAVPKNCIWLLREMPNGEYFCHIHEKSCTAVIGVGMIGGISCKETSVSPEEAFRQALRAYEQATR